jgi:hypothetical protein
MKKIILSVAAVFAFGFANAQEAEGGKGFTKGDSDSLQKKQVM